MEGYHFLEISILETLFMEMNPQRSNEVQLQTSKIMWVVLR